MLPVIGLSLLLMGFAKTGLAWNAVGHRVVAQIAYSELNPSAQQNLKQLTPNFIADNVYPDTIKAQGITAYNHWHYIALPDSPDHTATQRPKRENALWALRTQYEILANPAVGDRQRRRALQFYSHILADIHQPLHCIEQYTQQLKRGDQGGNRVPIRSAVADNLHAYWDRGGGVLKPGNIRKLVADIQARWPRSQLRTQLQEPSARAWVEHSHQIARAEVYQLKPGARPNGIYQHNARKITEQQLALAGYRLADQLNVLFSGKSKNAIPVSARRVSAQLLDAV